MYLWAITDLVVIKIEFSFFDSLTNFLYWLWVGSHLVSVSSYTSETQHTEHIKTGGVHGYRDLKMPEIFPYFDTKGDHITFKIAHAGFWTLAKTRRGTLGVPWVYTYKDEDYLLKK